MFSFQAVKMLNFIFFESIFYKSIFWQKVSFCLIFVPDLLLYRQNIPDERSYFPFRACRLKKKQQHEANKVKLHGLQSEQGLSSRCDLVRHIYGRLTSLGQQ